MICEFPPIMNLRISVLLVVCVLMNFYDFAEFINDSSISIIYFRLRTATATATANRGSSSQFHGHQTL